MGGYDRIKRDYDDLLNKYNELEYRTRAVRRTSPGTTRIMSPGRSSRRIVSTRVIPPSGTVVNDLNSRIRQLEEENAGLRSMNGYL